MKPSILAIIIASILLLGVLCLAQDASAPAAVAVSAQGAPAAPAAVVGAPAAPAPSPSLSMVSNLVAKIPSALPSWVIAVIAFLVELGLRFYPTAQPKSLLLYAASMLGLLGAGLSKLSGILDNVVQNIAPASPPSA